MTFKEMIDLLLTVKVEVSEAPKVIAVINALGEKAKENDE